MTAAAIGDLNHALSRISVETSSTQEGRLGNRTDAHLGIRELDALRALDMVAPPEAAELREPLVELYRGLTSGDHLRLEQRTSHSGPAIQAAISRVLSADTTAVAGNQDSVIKEAKLRRVLSAFHSTVADIQRRAALNSRD